MRKEKDYSWLLYVGGLIMIIGFFVSIDIAMFVNETAGLIYFLITCAIICPMFLICGIKGEGF